MGKYVTKNQKVDEKRVVSVRIRRPIFEAFKGASIAAEQHGYSMTLSGVFETAMEDAISEFKDISGVDYQDITTSKLKKISSISATFLAVKCGWLRQSRPMVSMRMGWKKLSLWFAATLINT
jgi:hypothetical protein